jgi:iodotyrosine deiodinase
MDDRSTPANTVPLRFVERPHPEILERARAFRQEMDRRRSVRHFSDEPVPLSVIEEVVRTASTAPSGAHKQPWTFCVVGSPVLKRRIREAAEEEERINYAGRMSAEWLRDLGPLGTDASKPFLETAPWLVVVFKQAYGVDTVGERHSNYYVQESVGIATGLLLAAAQYAGLATLTHTPSPMNFLSEVLGRPVNERPFLLIPMGFPASGCRVPDLLRKPLTEVLVPYL